MHVLYLFSISQAGSDSTIDRQNASFANLPVVTYLHLRILSLQ